MDQRNGSLEPLTDAGRGPGTADALLPADLVLRGLRPDTLQGSRFRGTWQRVLHAAAFAHRDHLGLHTGHELATRDAVTYAAERAGLWRSRFLAGDKYLVVAETALDALSCYELAAPDAARFISIGPIPRRRGLGADYVAQLSAELTAIRPSLAVFAAFPATPRGEQLTVELRLLVKRAAPQLAVERVSPPVGCDWLQALQRRGREGINSLQGAPLKAHSSG